MDKFPITKEGYAALEKELHTLKTIRRPEITEAIAVAREHGDLKENAEYHAAREQQSFNEGRIQELESVIGHAQIIDPSAMSGDTVKFGARVTVVDEDTDVEETLTIVGEYETDTSAGKISITAPVSRALIGKRAGDSVEVRTPKGLRTYEVLAVKYK
ncbi:MAG: transcription elongation factor GreA [Alphaproteobacteria bacterium]|nr:transcription elongation factor GreA [Alphaproteobacteria bacterium]